MNDTSLDELITAANPVDSTVANELDLNSAEDELMNGVLATDARFNVPEQATARSRWRLRGLGFAAAAVCAIAVGILLVGGSGSDPTSSDSAWAAEQVRFAEESPLVLLNLPGWTVGYANEETRVDGEMDFVPPGEKYDPRALLETTLHWRGLPLSDWTEDRGSEPGVQEFTAPVLDTTASVFENEEDGLLFMSALWQQEGRVLELRSQVQDRQTFKDLLSGLVKVDVDQWLSALPESSVPVADNSAVAEEMLNGIPLPPGFDPASIKVEELTKDRYQLGVVVLRTVTCSWLDRWATARSRGAEDEARTAADVMTAAKDWPLVHEMGRSGDYQHVVWRVGDAMRGDSLSGSELSDLGLGCSEMGIDLTNP